MAWLSRGIAASQLSFEGNVHQQLLCGIPLPLAMVLRKNAAESPSHGRGEQVPSCTVWRCVSIGVFSIRSATRMTGPCTSSYPCHSLNIMGTPQKLKLPPLQSVQVRPRHCAVAAEATALGNAGLSSLTDCGRYSIIRYAGDGACRNAFLQQM